MDVIPLEDEYLFTPAGDPSKPHTAQFYAFNTEIVLSAFGDEETVRAGFADALEAACFDTLAEGIATKDLVNLMEGVTPTPVGSARFIAAIRERLEKRLA